MVGLLIVAIAINCDDARSKNEETLSLRRVSVADVEKLVAEEVVEHGRTVSFELYGSDDTDLSTTPYMETSRNANFRASRMTAFKQGQRLVLEHIPAKGKPEPYVEASVSAAGVFPRLVREQIESQHKLAAKLLENESDVSLDRRIALWLIQAAREPIAK